MRFNKYLMEKEIQPEIVFLVGLPGSGKSTYIRKHLRGYTVVSNDEIVEKYAKKWKVNYTEAWNKLDFSVVLREVEAIFQKAVRENKNIVVDNTNLTVKSRKKFPTPLNYRRMAIVLGTDEKTRQEYIEKRKKETGKDIPADVIKKMKEIYVKPSKSEGFVEIKEV
jgi:predicted kinase